MSREAKAEFFAYRKRSDDEAANLRDIKNAVELMNRDGVTFIRATLVDGNQMLVESRHDATGIWIEGWRIEPDEIPAFESPVGRA